MSNGDYYSQPQYGYNQQYPQQGYSQYPQQGYAEYPQQGFADTRGYYDQSQQYNQQPQYGPQGTEQDRGLLGALGGGAAGAFGGHKVNHGFLGAIGGAIAGSLAEDYAKKHRKNGKHGKQQFGNASVGSMASSFFNQKK